MSLFDEDKVERHPAYGNIQFCRTTGHVNLYDSPLKHQHFVTLRIQCAEFERGLNRRWHRGLLSEQVVEVWMSASQFAEAITNMNTSGVPCTLHRYRDPKTGENVVASLPDVDSDKETFVEDIRERVADLVVQARKANDALAEAKSRKTVRKKDLDELEKLLFKLQQELESNLPYVQETFFEAMEKTTQKAKTEIVALADQLVHNRGLQAMGIESDRLLGEAQDEDVIDVEGEG